MPVQVVADTHEGCRREGAPDGPCGTTWRCEGRSVFGPSSTKPRYLNSRFKVVQPNPLTQPSPSLERRRVQVTKTPQRSGRCIVITTSQVSTLLMNGPPRSSGKSSAISPGGGVGACPPSPLSPCHRPGQLLRDLVGAAGEPSKSTRVTPQAPHRVYCEKGGRYRG